MGKAELKVPGGKLLRAFTTLREGRIEEVRITGDFFMHPEEVLEELERRLRGTPAERGAVRGVVEEFFRSSAPTVLGADPEHFIEVVLRSISAA